MDSGIGFGFGFGCGFRSVFFFFFFYVKMCGGGGGGFTLVCCFSGEEMAWDVGWAGGGLFEGCNVGGRRVGGVLAR